jgi:Protein tyrosine and serine/threonine kinase
MVSTGREVLRVESISKANNKYMTLPEQDVAIKLFRGVGAAVRESSFIRQAEVIRALQEQEQEQEGSYNIIHLRAVIPTTTPPALVMELAARGDLLTYLQSDSAQKADAAELLGIAKQV